MGLDPRDKPGPRHIGVGLPDLITDEQFEGLTPAEQCYVRSVYWRFEDSQVYARDADAMRLLAIEGRGPVPVDPEETASRYGTPGL